MGIKSYLNPQPSAVEREDKNCVKPKPTNLDGSEFEKNDKEKNERVIRRGCNR
ncbi:hypothetical protein [Legionella micdadei]|uniref:Uncharacterized protein n=1 Tax=Legionella micdadei TaxID=451 RepID=A0A098GFN8_LEGMI|nr:hypothetical protein [Legionella micdadei]KTD28144.1 hypothetical protein Lmic_1255 [Legionella micdadei]NSL16774.1 hypothetical protein [Legionella micdadei]CEG61273.1 protein of unknown function [Legionella micdadei]SCY34456.1 hypothetical protein SAMN02982997_01483 [Legionella micdadei]